MVTVMAAKAERVEAPPPLADVFPGETIALSTGEVITVGPISAYAVAHDAPALVGRLMGKLMPIRAVLADAERAHEHLPLVLEAASGEIIALVCHLTGLPRERVDNPPPKGILGHELMGIMVAFVRQNADFFARLLELVGSVRDGLGWSGQRLSSASSVPDSESRS